MEEFDPIGLTTIELKTLSLTVTSPTTLQATLTIEKSGIYFFRAYRAEDKALV
jgi:hypothetical protein